jgi:UDP-N-acetylmuramate--alanine ligase
MPPVVQETAKTKTTYVTVPSSQFAGQRIHFIGIGGSGMSGLARMLMDCGATVTGSEPTPNAVSLELGKRGAKISRDQVGSLLSKDVDLVVRTAAVKDNNDEYQVALKLGLRTVKYAELLGLVMQERFGVAVAGTHGKSTTTAMTAFALIEAGLDPSFVVGGTIAQLGSVGSRSGTGQAFVAEACEFDRSFHNLHPKVAIITNVEADHLDCYKDLDDIVDSFRTFSRILPEDGLIITLATDANVARVIDGLQQRVETCALLSSDRGTPTASIRPVAWATRVLGLENGCYTGEVSYNGTVVGCLRLSVPGKHNLINATMALAACNAAGADLGKSIDALNRFHGVDRRQTPVGVFNGVQVVDDYGHHPTEIRATLAALRERYQPKRLIAVFQPHQYSRTRLLFNDFVTAFDHADVVVLPPIYGARDTEADRAAVSSPLLADHIRQTGRDAAAFPDFAAALAHVKAVAQPGDLVVTMGAGNIWEIARDLVS